MTVSDAVAEGDRRKSLAALRDRLAKDLDVETDGRTVVQLAKELRLVIAELDALPKAEGGSKVDEVARKREERRARASAQTRS